MFFFFNDTATTEIYTLSLHDALPISSDSISTRSAKAGDPFTATVSQDERITRDRKSTRLNSSHGYISYAVFCLKKKKNPDQSTHRPHGRKPLNRAETRQQRSRSDAVT